MKTNGILSRLCRSLIATALVFSTSTLFALPDYDFRNPVLVSGTDLQIGAVYRFSNVRPGVDGMITITDMVKVVLTQLDGPSGFAEAFQPYIFCPGKSTGYVEFNLSFVQTGTNTPIVMAEVPMTAIDIDGYEFPDEKLYELDQMQETASSYVAYDMLGTNLTVKKMGSWYEAENKTAVTYDGIDTVQRDVMFSLVHANVSSVNVRVGAENKSKNDMDRLRSVYFQKFFFASGLLPVYADGLVSFKGVKKENEITLMWELTNLKEYRSVVVERATNGGNFEPIAQLTPSYNNVGKAAGSYTDQPTLKGTVLYRLKMISNEGVPLYSNILMFKMNGAAGAFKVFPTVVDDATTLQLTSAQKETVTVRVIDYNGRIMLNKQFTAQNGENSISVDGMSKFARGNYVISVYAANEVHSQKMIKL